MSKARVTDFTQKPNNIENLYRYGTPEVPDTVLRFHSQNGLISSQQNTTPASGNSTVFPSIIIKAPLCQSILYDDIGNSRVRVWDLVILIPNVVFLLFLLLKLRGAIAKLRNTNSPIFTAFYILVCVASVISVLRCIVSMTVNATVRAGDITDKVLWLLLRFFLLATELSIVIFGLAFGHLDSRRSIQRVLVVTSLLALLYSCTQGTLEFVYPDPQFKVKVTPNSTIQDFDIFGHGGMIFWLSSSIFFFLVYSVIFILPWTNLKKKFALPPKRSFYRYSAFLAVLNVTQAVGSALLYSNINAGMCVVDITAYAYFTCFIPIVYLVFLRKFFRVSQPSILFSYKNQIDEIPDEDTVSMPYQTSVARSDETDSITGSYDSTHFDRYQKTLIANGAINTVDVDISPSSPSSDFYQASA